MKPMHVGWLVAFGRDAAGNYLMRCKCSRVVVLAPRKLTQAKYSKRRLRCRPCTVMMIKIFRKHQWKKRRANEQVRPLRAYVELSYTAPATIDNVEFAIDVGIKGIG